MSFFSGYDSEAIGFDSVSQNPKTAADSSSQTTEYASNEIGSQATASSMFGTQTSKDTPIHELPEEQLNVDYISLNMFLNRVVPTMLEALEDNDENHLLGNESDSDNEDAFHAELYQVLEYSNSCDESKISSGGGDIGVKKTPSVLSMSWSSAGNTLAISLGQAHHDTWCEHDGLIQVYTVKRSAGDKLAHFYDVTHNDCVTVLQYHPRIAALLAYASTAGEVVVRSLRNATDTGLGDGAFLTSPPGSHGTRRVSAIQWADPKLAIDLLMMQSAGASKRRGASDQVLISAGTDGTVYAWQVNANLDVFSRIVCFHLGGASPGKQIPDITCLDFVRCNEGNTAAAIPREVFVVGCKSGQLIRCNIRSGISVVGTDMIDPTSVSLEPHHSCVLSVIFCNQRPGTFASISSDSELRIYNVEHPSPLRVICIDEALSCAAWITNNPSFVVLGLGKLDNHGQPMNMYNVVTGKQQLVEGLKLGEYKKVSKSLSTTAITINSNSTHRIAVGDNEGKVIVWDIPVTGAVQRVQAREDF